MSAWALERSVQSLIVKADALSAFLVGEMAGMLARLASVTGTTRQVVPLLLGTTRRWAVDDFDLRVVVLLHY